MAHKPRDVDKAGALAAKRRGEAFDTKQADNASFHGHTALQAEEFRGKIQRGLGVVIEHGQHKISAGQHAIEMDVTAADLSRDDLGALGTTVNHLRRTPSDLFGATHKKKGFREELVSVSCEIGSFIKICKRFDVDVPETVRQWAVEAKSKSGSVNLS